MKTTAIIKKGGMQKILSQGRLVWPETDFLKLGSVKH